MTAQQKPQDKLPPPPMWDFSATSLKPEITPLRPKGQQPRVPSVWYTSEVWQSIRYIVQKCSEEVGWVGLVETLPDGDYLITDVFVPKQEVSGVTTDIEHDALTVLTLELLNQGIDTGQLFYWGHSHVNMGVGPSGQDERQLAEYIEHCPRFIREIRNKKGEVKVDVFDRDAGVVYQCVSAAPYADKIEPALIKELDMIIAANVQKKVWSQHQSGRTQGFQQTSRSWERDEKTGGWTQVPQSASQASYWGQKKPQEFAAVSYNGLATVNFEGEAYVLD